MYMLLEWYSFHISITVGTITSTYEAVGRIAKVGKPVEEAARKKAWKLNEKSQLHV